jgi:hypothetical protein
MRISHALGNPLTAFAAITMLAGCSGGNPQSGAPPLATPYDAAARQSVPWSGAKPPAYAPSHSFFHPSASGQPLIFVSELSNPEGVAIFVQANGNAKVGEIVGDIYGPSGLATDREGDVYITNNNSGTINVFAPPYTTFPKLTLDDTGNYPDDVAISGRGLVAVANFNPSVTFYRKNSTKPCATVADASFGGIIHDAFDDAGDLYVDGENGSGFVVGEIRGGCKATTIERLSTGNAIGSWPGAIKVDKHDRVAIEDGYGQVIYTYNPPVNGSLGTPVTTTPLPGVAGGYNFAFAASGRDVYVADYYNGVIDEYAYPAGGTAEDTFSVGDTQGVALTPPLAP